MIPRIMHQIYLGGPFPPVLEDNVERLKATNPAWEHRLYRERDAEHFVAGVYGDEAAEAWRRIDPRYGAARADLLRHLLIYAYGGVYCDIKSGFSRPLDQVLRDNDTYVLAQWFPNMHKELAHIPEGEFINWFIIAEPHHPFSAAAICRILDNIARYKPWHAVGRNGVLRTTGPIAYTLAIHPLLDKYPNRVATLHELGAYFSIDGYDPTSAFRNRHYSRLRQPVVRLNPVETAISRAIGAFRGVRVWRHDGAGAEPRLDPRLIRQLASTSKFIQR